MLEYIVLGLIVFICFFLSEDRILYLFLFLIPFHSFIKSCFNFFYGGGEIFSFWKEIVILIIALKVFRKSESRLNPFIIFLILTFLIYVFVFFVVADGSASALPALRDHIFPLIFFIAISNIKLNVLFFKKIIYIITIGILLTDIFGVIQHYFFNQEISFIMGRIDFIDSEGFIQYTTTSARIMGFERMAGILGGGPNMFGIFNGYAIVFLFGIVTNANKTIIDKKELFFFKFVMLFSLVCMILSFSRAGWGISIIGVFLLLYFNKQINRVKYFSILLVAFLFTGIMISFFIPDAGDIIVNSLSGKEASASKRGEMISNLIPRVLDEPFGHGLGTADNRYKGHIFFAESAFINIAFEIGILGLFYLLTIHFVIIKEMFKFKKDNYFSKTAISITVGTLIISFFSVNPYGMPYIYFWWLILGLGVNIYIVQSVRVKKIS